MADAERAGASSGGVSGAGATRGVSVMIQSAQRAVALARGAEALLLGTAAMLLALSAAAASGAALGTPAAWGAAFLAGVCAAGSWWLERRPRVDRLALKVDRKLRQNGGLFTAFEQEEREPGSPLTRLLASEVRDRVRPGAVVRAALPDSLPLLALPFIAAALLALVLESRSRSGDELAWIAPLARGLSGELQEARDLALDAARAREISESDLREVLELEGSARELARLAREDAPDPVALEVRLESLRGEVTETARRLASAPDLAAALDRAATYADGALMGLAEDEERGEGRDSVHSRDVEGGDHPLPDGAESVAASAGSAPDSTGGTETTLAQEDPDGRMSGRALPADPGEALSTGPVATASGVATGRWWPEHFTGVVGRWVEVRRARAEESED